MGALSRRVTEALGLLLVITLGIRLAAWMLEPLTVPLLVVVVLASLVVMVLRGRWS